MENQLNHKGYLFNPKSSTSVSCCNTLQEVKLSSKKNSISLNSGTQENVIILATELVPVYGNNSTSLASYNNSTGEFTLSGSGTLALQINYLLNLQSVGGNINIKLYRKRAAVSSVIDEKMLYIQAPSLGGSIPFTCNFEDADIIWLTYLAPGTEIMLANNFPTPAVEIRLTELEVTGGSGDLSNYYTKTQIDSLFNEDHQSQFGILSKRADDDFNLTSKLLALTGKPVTLFDGMQITFSLSSSIPYNWQNKVNPLIYVDGYNGVPIVNAVWYYIDPKYNQLDKNTFTRGVGTLTYNKDSNVWAYSNKQFTVGQFYVFGDPYDVPGFLRLQGVDVGSQNDYPTYPGIFDKNKPNFTLDFSDTAIVGNSVNSPSYEVTAGQIANITGDFSLGSMSNGAGVLAQWNTDGAFYGNTVTGAPLVARMENTSSGTVTIVNFDASRIVNTGSETLTRRYALTYFFKL